LEPVLTANKIDLSLLWTVTIKNAYTTRRSQRFYMGAAPCLKNS